jgi:hypothetical protein
MRTALRMRVNMSAIGSVIMSSGFLYQLAFFTPGISPWSANLRKQMRQIPNFRYTPRGRPHRPQRLSRRVVNFGTRSALAIFDLLATAKPILRQ